MTLPEPPATNAERWAESDRALVERLRDVILTEGPITFARYMAAVLYDPDHGYYTTREDRTTRAGDYLTAPELHPIFGVTLAAQVEEVWVASDGRRPSPCGRRRPAAARSGSPSSISLRPPDHRARRPSATSRSRSIRRVRRRPARG